MKKGRGIIRYRDRARQIKDFSGLRFERGITPTDIDCFVEFNNELFIFCELKHKGAEMPYGQRLSLERLSDAINKAGYKSIVLVAEHESPVGEDIPAHEAIVTEYRADGRWTEPMGKKTLREAMDIIKKY